MIVVFRSLTRSCLFLALLIAARVDGQIRATFFGLRIGSEGAVWVHRWCRRIVRALSIPSTVEGPIPYAAARGLALVSNHLSYLDILIYSATTPFVMVAKSELKTWPLLGWITARAGTVYVQRANVKAGQTQTHAQVNAAMAKAYRSGLQSSSFPKEPPRTEGAYCPSAAASTTPSSRITCLSRRSLSPTRSTTPNPADRSSGTSASGET